MCEHIPESSGECITCIIASWRCCLLKNFASPLASWLANICFKAKISSGVRARDIGFCFGVSTACAKYKSLSSSYITTFVLASISFLSWEPKISLNFLKGIPKYSSKVGP